MSQFGTSGQFFLCLVGTQDNVCLGNRKLTYTGQTVHLTGILVTEQGGSLRHSVGQISVGMLLIHVYIVLERAGHGTKCHGLLVLIILV